MKQNFIDRAINFVAPAWGFQRMKYRAAITLAKEQTRRYEAASGGRRTSNWQASGTSATAEIHSALTWLRNRSRDLVRNNPYAKKAVNEIATNISGTGIIPKPIGLPKTLDKKLKDAWNGWAGKTTCDYDNHLTFYGLQELVSRTVAESGECLVRRHIVKDKMMPIPLRLQVLEGDFIDTTRYESLLDNGGYIYYGVEFNKDNQVVAYWLWDYHPGDNIRFTIKSSRIPAEEIIHVFKKERAGQFRGVPMGAASMLRLKDLDEYEDAQLIRQKIAACFSVFVTDSSITLPDAANKEEELLEKVEPGIIERLSPGKTISVATPPDAGQSYEPYVKGVLRAVAAGYNMDYVTMTGDLTAVNFSSGRMGWIQFHRNITSLQVHMLIPMYCDKVWNWFMQVAVIQGVARKIDTQVTWTPPRREMIDPAKEIKAQVEAIRGGLTSWQETARENGYDAEELLDQMTEDAKNFGTSGLMPFCDPRYDTNRVDPNADAGNTDSTHAEN